MSSPRKHHYLPQFYLRGFSVDGLSLHQVEKRGSRRYGCRIKDTAEIRDFHELDGEGVDDPNALERRLAEVEGFQARILKDGLAAGIHNVGSREALIEFVAVMRMRVPAIKAHVDRSYGSMIRGTAELLERSGKLPQVPPGYEDTLSIKNLDINALNWKCLDVMFRMSANEQTLGILNSMRATIYRAPFGSFFITGDQPVALYHENASCRSLGAGPATPGIEISFPLSSRALLKLDHHSGNDVDCLATIEEVVEFNRRTVVMAKEYVFAGEARSRVSSLVANHSDTFAGFRHEDIRSDNDFLQVHRFIPVGPA